MDEEKPVFRIEISTNCVQSFNNCPFYFKDRGSYSRCDCYCSAQKMRATTPQDLLANCPFQRNSHVEVVALFHNLN